MRQDKLELINISLPHVDNHEFHEAWANGEPQDIEAPPIEIIRSDAVIADINWYLDLNFDPPPSSSIFPDYYWTIMIAKQYDKQAIASRSSVQLPVEDDTRLFVFLQPQSVLYGHFILEGLPRLLIANYCNLHLGASLRPVVHANSPSFVKEFVALAMPDAEPFIIPPGMYIRGRFSFCSAPGLHEYLYHPRVVSLLRSFTATISSAAANVACSFGASEDEYKNNSIFLSRLGVQSMTSTPEMSLENSISGFLAKHGYKTLVPHELSQSLKIHYFNHCNTLISQYCSGLHNAMFSPPGTRVLSLGLTNRVQAMISYVLGHKLFISALPANMQEFSRDYYEFCVPR